MELRHRFLAVVIFILAVAGCCNVVPPNKPLENAETSILKSTLDNGMTVLVRPSSRNPLASLNLLVKTGNASEAEFLGCGVTHFVEHMVFNGTHNLKSGQVEKEIAAIGGYINAYTSFDYTVYKIIVPCENFDIALGLLADIVFNASLDKEEFERERDVILKEIKLGQDDVDRRLSQLIFSSSYQDHPYKFPIIGTEALFKKVTLDDLAGFYRRNYIPNNMILGICGDVNAAETFEKVKGVFSKFDEGRPPADFFTKEPRQIAFNEVRQDQDIQIARIAFVYKGVDIRSRHLYALDVLSYILGGSEGSRLNKRLCREKILAESVSSYNFTPKSEGIFAINCASKDNKIEPIKEEVFAEIEKLKTGLVSDDELEKAKNAVVSGYLFEHESIDGLGAAMVADAALTGDAAFSRLYVKNIGEVAKQDIKNAAKAFLSKENLTVVLLSPKAGDFGKDAAGEDKRDSLDIQKSVLSNGMVLLMMADNSLPIVSVNVALRAGLRAENADNNGISNLTADTLITGTNKFSRDDIINLLELKGARFQTISGKDSINISLQFLSKDAEAMVGLLRELLFFPVFAQEEVDIEKNRIIAQIKDKEDNIFDFGFNLLRSSLFLRHPYGFDILGTQASLGRISRQDIKKFHSDFFTADNMVVAIYGDIDKEKIFKIFNDEWAQFKPEKIKIEPPAETPQDVQRLEEKELRKEQSLILLGFHTVTLDDDDRYTLELISAILSGESGLLYEKIRGESGISYTQGSAAVAGIDKGYFIIYVATTQENIGKAKDVISSILDKLKKSAIEPQAISQAKSYLIGKQLRDLETNYNLAFNTSLNELYGLGFDDFRKYAAKINAVTAEDISKAAGKYLDLNKASIIELKSKKGE